MRLWYLRSADLLVAAVTAWQSYDATAASLLTETPRVVGSAPNFRGVAALAPSALQSRGSSGVTLRSYAGRLQKHLRLDRVAGLHQAGGCLDDAPDPTLLPSPWPLPANSSKGGYGPLAKIFYINLDRSVERRASMEKQLLRSGVPFERFPAVDAEDVKAGKYNDALRRLGVGIGEKMKEEWGSLACALSHRLLYEHIATSNPHGNETYMVLEDDAIMLPGWQGRLNTLLPTVPRNASAITCGIWGRTRCSDVFTKGLALATHPFWRAETPDWYYYGGATSVLLFSSSLPSLLGHLKHQPMNHIDASLLSGGAIHTYAMTTPFVKPGDFGSVRLREDNDLT